MLHRGRRGAIYPLPARRQPRGRRSAAATARRAGRHRKTDPGAGRRHPACTCGGRDSADRGFPAPRGRKHPCRRYLDRSRSCQSFAGRRPADPPAGFRSPCFLLWKRGLPNRHARRRQRVLGPFRGRRHRIRASDRTSVQLQQPAGRLPDVRRLRQDHRHRRGPGDSRQTQNHLRGRRGLLARRDHAGVERPARSQCLQVRFSDPYAVLPTYGRTETAPVVRQRVFSRLERLLRLHRQRAAQDPVPGDESPLHGQNRLSRLRRLAPAQRGPLRQNRRQNHRRPGRDAGGDARRFLRLARAGRSRHENRRPHPHRDTQPPAIPHGRGAGLPDPRPALLDAFGRREPAHQSFDLAGQQPRGFALYSRRAVDRPAPARHEPSGRCARTIARHRQHGDRRRTRRGGDPCCRLDRRYRPGGGLQRRRGRLQRTAESLIERKKKPDGRLPYGTLQNRGTHLAAQPGSVDHRERCPAEQPEEYRRADPARGDDLHHGRKRQRQIVAGQRHPLSRIAAPAVRHRAQTGRFRRHRRRPFDASFGRNGRSEPDRQILAVESRDLYQSLRRDPQTLRRPALRPAVGIQPLAFLVQHRRRPLRGVPGRGIHQGRHAVHGRYGASVRSLRRQALQR